MFKLHNAVIIAIVVTVVVLLFATTTRAADFTITPTSATTFRWPVSDASPVARHELLDGARIEVLQVGAIAAAGTLEVRNSAFLRVELLNASTSVHAGSFIFNNCTLSYFFAEGRVVAGQNQQPAQNQQSGGVGNDTSSWWFPLNNSGAIVITKNIFTSPQQVDTQYLKTGKAKAALDAIVAAPYVTRYTAFARAHIAVTMRNADRFVFSRNSIAQVFDDQGPQGNASDIAISPFFQHLGAALFLMFDAENCSSGVDISHNALSTTKSVLGFNINAMRLQTVPFFNVTHNTAVVADSPTGPHDGVNFVCYTHIDTVKQFNLNFNTIQQKLSTAYLAYGSVALQIARCIVANGAPQLATDTPSWLRFIGTFSISHNTIDLVSHIGLDVGLEHDREITNVTELLIDHNTVRFSSTTETLDALTQSSTRDPLRRGSAELFNGIIVNLKSNVTGGVGLISLSSNTVENHIVGSAISLGRGHIFSAASAQMPRVWYGVAEFRVSHNRVSTFPRWHPITIATASLPKDRFGVGAVAGIDVWLSSVNDTRLFAVNNNTISPFCAPVGPSGISVDIGFPTNLGGGVRDVGTISISGNFVNVTAMHHTLFAVNESGAFAFTPTDLVATPKVLIERNSFLMHVDSDAQRTSFGTLRLHLKPTRQLNVSVARNTLRLYGGTVPVSAIEAIAAPLFISAQSFLSYTLGNMSIVGNDILFSNPLSCPLLGCNAITLAFATVRAVTGGIFIESNRIEVNSTVLPPALLSPSSSTVRFLLQAVLLSVASGDGIKPELFPKIQLVISKRALMANTSIFRLSRNDIRVRAPTSCASALVLVSAGLVEIDRFEYDHNRVALHLDDDLSAPTAPLANMEYPPRGPCHGCAIVFASFPDKVRINYGGLGVLNLDVVQLLGHEYVIRSASVAFNEFTIDKGTVGSFFDFFHANVSNFASSSTARNASAFRVSDTLQGRPIGPVRIGTTTTPAPLPPGAPPLPTTAAPQPKFILAPPESICGAEGGASAAAAAFGFRFERNVYNFTAAENCQKMSNTTFPSSVSADNKKVPFLATVCRLLTVRGRAGDELQLCFANESFNASTPGDSSLIDISGGERDDASSAAGGPAASPPSWMRRRTVHISFANSTFSLECNSRGRFSTSPSASQSSAELYFKAIPFAYCGFVRETSPTSIADGQPSRRTQINVNVGAGSAVRITAAAEHPPVALFSGRWATPQRSSVSIADSDIEINERVLALPAGAASAVAIAVLPMGAAVHIYRSRLKHYDPRWSWYRFTNAELAQLRRIRTLLAYAHVSVETDPVATARLVQDGNADPVMPMRPAPGTPVVLFNISNFNISGAGGSDEKHYSLTDLNYVPYKALSSPLYNALIDCVWISAYRVKEKSKFFFSFVQVKGDISESFKVCPQTETRSLTPTVSLVPFCADFKFTILDAENRNLRANAVRGQLRVVRWAISLERDRDTPAPLAAGRRWLVGGGPWPAPEGEEQSASVTKFRQGLGNLTAYTDPVFIERFGIPQLRIAPPGTPATGNSAEEERRLVADAAAEESSTVAYIVNASTSKLGVVSKASQFVIAIPIQFSPDLDADRSHVFRVNISSTLLTCRVAGGAEWVTAALPLLSRFGRFVPESTLSAARTLGAITAIATLPMSGPLAGAGLSRLEALSAVFFCPTSADGDAPLSFLESPLGWQSGVGWGRYYRGAIIGNITILCIVFGVQLVGAFVKMIQALSKRSKDRAAAMQSATRTRLVVRDGRTFTITESVGGGRGRSKTAPKIAADALAEKAVMLGMQQNALSAQGELDETTRKAIRDARAKNSMNIFTGLALLQCPSALLIPATILLQGSISAATALLVRRFDLGPESSGPNDRFLGGFMPAIYLVIVGAFYFIVFRSLPASKWVQWRPTLLSERRDPPSISARLLKTKLRKWFDGCKYCEAEVIEYRRKFGAAVQHPDQQRIDHENNKKKNNNNSSREMMSYSRAMAATSPSASAENSPTSKNLSGSSTPRYGTPSRRGKSPSIRIPHHHGGGASFADSSATNNNNLSISFAGGGAGDDYYEYENRRDFLRHEFVLHNLEHAKTIDGRRRRSLFESFVIKCRETIFYESGKWVIARPPLPPELLLSSPLLPNQNQNQKLSNVQDFSRALSSPSAWNAGGGAASSSSAPATPSDLPPARLAELEQKRQRLIAEHEMHDPHFVRRFGRFFASCPPATTWYPLFHFVEGLVIAAVVGYARYYAACSPTLMLLLCLVTAVSFVVVVSTRPKRRSTASALLIWMSTLMLIMCACGLVGVFTGPDTTTGENAMHAFVVIEVIGQFSSIGLAAIDLAYYWYLRVAPSLPLFWVAFRHYWMHKTLLKKDDIDFDSNNAALLGGGRGNRFDFNPAFQRLSFGERINRKKEAGEPLSFEEKNSLVQHNIERFVAPEPLDTRSRRVGSVCWDVQNDSHFSNPHHHEPRRNHNNLTKNSIARDNKFSNQHQQHQRGRRNSPPLLFSSDDEDFDEEDEEEDEYDHHHYSNDYRGGSRRGSVLVAAAGGRNQHHKLPSRSVSLASIASPIGARPISPRRSGVGDRYGDGHFITTPQRNRHRGGMGDRRGSAAGEGGSFRRVDSGAGFASSPYSSSSSLLGSPVRRRSSAFDDRVPQENNSDLREFEEDQRRQEQERRDYYQHQLDYRPPYHDPLLFSDDENDADEDIPPPGQPPHLSSYYNSNASNSNQNQNIYHQSNHNQQQELPPQDQEADDLNLDAPFWSDDDENNDEAFVEMTLEEYHRRAAAFALL